MKKQNYLCKALNCANSSKFPGTAFYFFTFPADQERRMLWKERIKFEGQINSNCRVCSDHFSEVDISMNGARPALKKGAIPNLKPVQCSVDGCSSFQDDDSPFRFYLFPTSFKSVDTWEKFTKRNHFKHSPSSVICSMHFSASQFNGDHLKLDAVPDVCNVEEIEMKEEDPLADDIELKTITEEIEMKEEDQLADDILLTFLKPIAFRYIPY